MEKIGYIEIRISGSKGNLELAPDNYDIREIISILENAENLLYPGDKKDRPNISYRIEEGSVKHILKTSIQYIIGFNAIIGQVTHVQNIDFLDLDTAKAFENIQDIATKRNYLFTIKTSLNNSNEVKLTSQPNIIELRQYGQKLNFTFMVKLQTQVVKTKQIFTFIRKSLAL